MKTFLDTSSLFKLYHDEPGTEEIENLFNLTKITAVLLSEIAKIEFASATWKKVRNKELYEHEAHSLIEIFKGDYDKFVFVGVDNIIVLQALALLNKYGSQGLRSLDSLQLATAVTFKNHIDLNKTSDNLLNQFLRQEGLPV